jgi:serine/threonine protein phosphatase PrpC
MIKEFFKSLYSKLFPEESRKVFSEQPTRPLDAEALARALAGEGRSHVTVGFSTYSPPECSDPGESLYSLIGNSDGLKTLPDFGFAGVADSHRSGEMDAGLSQIALRTFSNHIIRTAVFDFFELESFEETSPLQDLVMDAMKVAETEVLKVDPKAEFSLTAGLTFAEVLIVGHRGSTRAYQFDRHHAEMVTTNSWFQEDNANDDNKKNEGQEITVYSRPVPRDGHLLLCSEGLWGNISQEEMHKIVLESGGPQFGCENLLNRAKDVDPKHSASAILIYFPPDFGT